MSVFLSLFSFPNKAVFEEVCDETLDSLTETFEELVENADHLAGADVNYSVSLPEILLLLQCKCSMRSQFRHDVLHFVLL